MEMLSTLPNLLLTSSVQEIWGYIVIVEGRLGKRSDVTAFNRLEKQEFDAGAALP